MQCYLLGAYLCLHAQRCVYKFICETNEFGGVLFDDTSFSLIMFILYSVKVLLLYS